MRHPLITLMYDDDVDDAVFVEFQHTPECDHVDETPIVFRTPIPAAHAIIEGIHRVLKAAGAVREHDEEPPQHFPRPAELDDPDRKRLN